MPPATKHPIVKFHQFFGCRAASQSPPDPLPTQMREQILIHPDKLSTFFQRCRRCFRLHTGSPVPLPGLRPAAEKDKKRFLSQAFVQFPALTRGSVRTALIAFQVQLQMETAAEQLAAPTGRPFLAVTPVSAPWLPAPAPAVGSLTIPPVTGLAQSSSSNASQYAGVTAGIIIACTFGPFVLTFLLVSGPKVAAALFKAVKSLWTCVWRLMCRLCQMAIGCWKQRRMVLPVVKNPATPAG